MLIRITFLWLHTRENLRKREPINAVHKGQPSGNTANCRDPESKLEAQTEKSSQHEITVFTEELICIEIQKDIKCYKPICVHYAPKEIPFENSFFFLVYMYFWIFTRKYFQTYRKVANIKILQRTPIYALTRFILYKHFYCFLYHMLSISLSLINFIWSCIRRAWPASRVGPWLQPP